MKSVRRSRLIVAMQALLAALVLFGGYLIYLDATVRERFEGRRWDLPGELYARPLELYEGARVERADLLGELEALGYVADGDTARPGHVADTPGRITLHTRGFRFWDGAEPSRTVSLELRGGKVASLRGKAGEDITLMRLEPLLFARIHPAHPEDRVLVKLADVPELLRNALLLVEDREFYVHSGFEISAMVRALVVNVREGELAQGGSTLTQQLVKNMYLTPRKTVLRKINELLMAVLLELHYDKAQILEAYVNEVYLAQDGNRAIHGFGLASEYFFGKPLGELDLAEVALLVAIVKGPSYYSPKRNPERARVRRNLVIDLLAENELIDAREADEAKARPLGLRSGFARDFRFPAYADRVRRELVAHYDARQLSTEGLKVFTSLDPILQRRAQDAMTRTIASLAAGATRLDALEGAAVLTSVAGGEIVAIVGGRESVPGGFNRALDAVRPIGSLVKPAIYLRALEEDGHTLLERISDEPVALDPGGGQPVWSPRNFDRKSHGEVTLLDALVNSYNQATVRLGLQLGVGEVAATIARLGVARPQPRVLSLLLGTGEMSPVDVSEMYLTISSGGFRKPLRSIRAVVSSRGTLETRFPFVVERVADPAATYLVDFALREVMRRGTGRSASESGESSNLAGKTGTTDDYRDSWFAGYSSHLLAVVWLGRDDDESTGLTGSRGALPAWRAVMSGEGAEERNPRPPSSVMMIPIDPESGMRTSAECDGARIVPFRKGTEPAEVHACTSQNEGLMSRMRRLLSDDED